MPKFDILPAARFNFYVYLATDHYVMHHAKSVATNGRRTGKATGSCRTDDAVATATNSKGEDKANGQGIMTRSIAMAALSLVEDSGNEIAPSFRSSTMSLNVCCKG